MDLQGYVDASYTGYPVALYGASQIDVTVDCDTVGRAIYLGGCFYGSAVARFKDIYSPVAVLCTDAYRGGALAGCAGLSIESTDVGSTYLSLDSWCAGISNQRVDPNLRYEDLRFHVKVRSEPTVATSMGGFIITQGAGSAAGNALRNITVSGMVDRSRQSSGTTNSVGEIYIYANGANPPTVDNLSLSGLTIKKPSGSFSSPYQVYIEAPGTAGNVNIVDCDLGEAVLRYLGPDPATAPSNVAELQLVNTKLLSLSNPGYSPRVSCVNSKILTGTTGAIESAHKLLNTTVGGSARIALIKTIDVALTGASVTVPSAIPAGYLDAVCGVVTGAVGGSTGYMVGTDDNAALFVESVNGSLGASFTPINANPAFHSAAPIFSPVASDLVVTSRIQNFTCGSLRIVIHYTQFAAPTH